MRRSLRFHLVAVVLLGAAGLALAAAGPGTLNFSNRVPLSGVDAPVYDVDCQTRLGSRFVGQLYAGPAPEALVPVGAPVPFREVGGQGTGYLSSPAEVMLPAVAAGSTAYVQLRAWEPTSSWLWAEARKRGASKIIAVVTGGDTGSGPPRLPADLVGLESFCLEELQQAPVIVRQPEPVLFHPGMTVEFGVTAAGSVPLAYQWEHNGQAISGETNTVLAIPDAGLEHIGVYAVRVSNAAGSAASAGVRAELIAWPAGGVVIFSNYRPRAGLDAPVVGVDGATRLGAWYLAQLYAGPTADRLVAVGEAQRFRDATPGYWDEPVPGGEVAIPGVPVGGQAFVQVRVWEAARGASYELASAGALGVSPVLEVVTGGPGRPTVPVLSGLTGFHLGFLPRIVRPPEPLTVAAGEEAALEVAVESVFPVVYEWLRDGTWFPGPTGARLAWDAVTAADAGVFQARVTSALGSVWSGEARLTVNDLELGTVNFANRVVLSGLDAPVYEADGVTRVAGSGMRARLWAGPSPNAMQPVGDAAGFGTGATAGYWSTPDRVRAIPGVQAGGVAYVQVRIWDGAVAAGYAEAVAAGARFGFSETFTVTTGGAGSPPSFPAELQGLESFTLQPPLVIAQAPRGGVFLAGETVRLTVEATGDGPLAYQWQRNGEDIAGATAPVLELPSVAVGDAGYFRVKVTDRQRTVTSVETLVAVAPLPEGAGIGLSNSDPDAGLDAPVFFLDGTTRLSGPNFVAQVWAGATAETLEPVTGAMRFGAGSQAGYWEPGVQPVAVVPGALPGQTVFVQVRVWDITLSGSFEEARANDAAVGFSEIVPVVTAGSGEMPVALKGLTSFRLGQRPMLASWPHSREVVQNRAFAFEVSVTSHEPVTYQWFRDGVAITGATGARLEFVAVSVADAGEYTVTVANRTGSVTTPAVSLTVLAPTGGGTIQMGTNAGGIGEAVLEADGQTPLAGSRYAVRLLAGWTPDTLTPVPSRSTFGVGVGAGYILGSLVTLAQVPPDTDVWVRVQAWDTWYGATYEAAAAQQRAGESEPFQVRTGGFGVAAGRLTSLKSFQLAGAEPPVIISQPPEYYWVIEGTPIGYPIVATNYVSIHWERSTPEGWVTLDGAQTPVLTFDAPTVADAGDFRAVLLGTGGVEVVSSTVTLSVGRVVRAGAGPEFTLRVPAGSGPEFRIEGSTNLTDWAFLTQVTDDGDTLELTEAAEAGASTTRYYRARSGATGQVVSDIAGFVEVELLPGYSMIGLPLDPPSRRVGDVFAGLPEFSILYKYYADGRGFVINTLWEGIWTTPDEELGPGEACLVGNPTDDVYRVTLQGVVPTGNLLRQIPAGWSLQALPLPLEGALDRDLGCPFRRLEMIARWDAWSGELGFSVYADGLWFPEAQPLPGPAPVIGPGEGFWIWKAAPQSWSTRFVPAP